MMAAALMTTACSSDDDSTSVSPKPADDQTVKSIPYTVTVGQGATTRASVANDDVTLQFADGDKLYVKDNSGNVYGCLTLQSGAGTDNGATFSGNLNYTGNAPAADLMLTATLVGVDDKLATTDGSKLTGFKAYNASDNICVTMADAVAKFSKLQGSNTYGAKSFALSQKTAFLKFKVILEDGTTPGDNAVAVTVKDGNTTLGNGTTVASGTAQFTDTYAEFVLPVADNTTISDDAKMWVGSVGTPADESIDLGGSNTLAAGKVYEVADKTKDFVRLWNGGPVWSTKNLGASSVTGYGNYYQWGVTTGYAESESHSFTWENYKWGTKSSLTKYNATDGKTKLDNEDDAAYVASSGTWRIPTIDEFGNLLSNATYTWTTVNSKNGGTFTGNGNYAGKAIFLPAGGHRAWDFNAMGEGGWYWSSSLDTNYQNVLYLIFGSNEAKTITAGRHYGFLVRPVRTN